MPHVLLRHKVANFDSWKPAFDSDQSRREAAGLKTVHLFNSLEDPNNVFIVFKYNDLEKAKAVFNDPDLKEFMVKNGVIEGPSIEWFGN